MPYGLTKIETPNMVDAYNKGEQRGYDVKERKRKQPILEAMESAKLKQNAQIDERNKKALSLQDISIKQKGIEMTNEAYTSANKGMDWIESTSTDMEKNGATPEQLQAFKTSQVEDLYNHTAESYGKDIADSFQNNPELMGRVASATNMSKERFTAPIAGLDAKGKPVYKQFSQSGKGKDVEGFTPLTSEYKAKGKGLEKTAQEDAITRALLERENVLKEKQQNIKSADFKLLDQQLAFQQKQDKRLATDIEAQDSMALYEEVIAGDLGSIYGIEEQFKIDKLRTQGARDLMSKRNRVVALMELAAAGKMKGQGQVSEGERQILKDAATILSDPNISEEAARRELQRGLKGLRQATQPAMDRRAAKQKQEEIDGALQWVLDNPDDPKAQAVRQKLGM